MWLVEPGGSEAFGGSEADIPGIRSLCREIIDHALIAYGKDAQMVSVLKRILGANDALIVDVLIEELP